jgi:hypothetical protein
MAIVVLVLWLFTAGAGFSLLVTSNLSRARPATATPAAQPATVPAAVGAASQAASKREMRRAARDRFDPPSLTAAKNAPIVPGLRSLVEFAHPAFAIVGLGFWLGFTMVHDRALGWIAFGLVTAAIGLGLTWYTANTRAARREGPRQSAPAPSFSNRIVILHGSAATVTFALAALTALVLSR